MEARKLQLVRDDDDTPSQASEETFTAPVAILRWSQPAVAMCYASFYARTHAVGKHFFDTNLQELMAIFDRKEPTIRGWLADLASDRYGAIHVAADAPTGALRITVFRVRAFAPRRPAKCDPQRPLLEKQPEKDSPDLLSGAVSPFEETRGAVIAPTRPEEDAGRPAAGPAARRFLAPEGAEKPPRDFAQNPARDFVQKPERDFEQKPADGAAELARLIEAKRAQHVRPPPPRPLEATRDFVRNPATDLDLRSSEITNLKRSRSSINGAFGAGKDPAGARQFEADLIAELQNRVPGLRGTFAHQVAKGVADGWLSWDVVEQVIHDGRDLVAAGKCPRLVVYFTGTIPKVFREHGHAWRRRPK